MNMEQKLCKDCKHVIPKDNIFDYRCGHPKMERVNLVTGESDPWYCSSLRAIDLNIPSPLIKCSRYGELWERKEIIVEIETDSDGVDKR